MNVLAVFGRVTAAGVRDFFARVEHDGKVSEIPLLYADLMSYRHFQCTVLAATGQMPWIASCEHRTPDDADSQWRLEVKNSLEREALQEQSQSKSPGTALN